MQPTDLREYWARTLYQWAAPRFLSSKAGWVEALPGLNSPRGRLLALSTQSPVLRDAFSARFPDLEIDIVTVKETDSGNLPPNVYNAVVIGPVLHDLELAHRRAIYRSLISSSHFGARIFLAGVVEAATSVESRVYAFVRNRSPSPELLSVEGWRHDLSQVGFRKIRYKGQVSLGLFRLGIFQAQTPRAVDLPNVL